MQGRGRGWGSGAGWPSRYDPKLCKTVLRLRSLGLSVRDIAGFLDVNAMTTYIWRKKYPEFATGLHRAGRTKGKQDVINILTHGTTNARYLVRHFTLSTT
jgi:transposase-like protein